MYNRKSFISIVTAVITIIASTAMAASPRPSICKTIDNIFADRVATDGAPLYSKVPSFGYDAPDVTVTGHKAKFDLPGASGCKISRWTNGRVIVVCNVAEVKTYTETAMWREWLSIFSTTIRLCYRDDPKVAFTSEIKEESWHFSVTPDKDKPWLAMSIFIMGTSTNTFVVMYEITVSATPKDMKLYIE